ncbi:SpoIIAA-like [Methanolobus vulcani]|jgi:hypothetical protein|uniref:SpoIIAA-like n=1 Tax=Methanolobus vulcani TaxID=38026 RepID=A0A7Z7B0D0_9EURY|nr:STAS/SEC14 domain-containing protein [Methanolobus vulcani]MDK2826732.1 hypothetical protein [Methanolobus sp.]MDK2946885.1 hypothetical protein [Methanolobus sp.]SDG06641.1 SpoIIAA-like [Methanolobus vulcani]
MIELIKDMPENVIAVRMSGKVTGDDYYEVLVPAIEGKVKKHEKVRLLYQVDTDIKITLDAMFDDLKLGVYNYNSFEKFALVSDVGWMADAVRMFKHIIPGTVKTYSNYEFPEAKAWISE